MGLVSDGGVHSSLDHLFKLCDIANEYDYQYLCTLLYGRSRHRPRSGKGFIAQLEQHLKTTGGKIASIVGRYYAMDRDKRWERIKEAYDLLVNGVGRSGYRYVCGDAKSADNGVTGEFIKPIVHVDAAGKPH